jgi:IS30 family transposase
MHLTARMKSDELVKLTIGAIRELRSRGMSVRNISKQIGVGRGTIYRSLRETQVVA